MPFLVMMSSMYKSKHIELLKSIATFVRHLHQDSLNLLFVHSQDQPVDILTKLHPTAHFHTLVNKLKLVPHPS